MKPQAQYLWRMAAGMVAYFLGLVAYNHFYTPLVHSPLRYGLLILVVLPTVWVVATILRFVASCDEMQRRIATEGAAFAGLATAFTCFSLLFVRDLGTTIHPEAGFYIFFLYYGIGASWSGARFR